MRALAGGMLAGLLFAVLVLAFGTAAIWLAMALAVGAIVFGCVDYVKHHGHGHGRHG